MMGWKWHYFQKVSVFENFPKYKYDPRESTIYLPFDLKKIFDKVLGNFENLYFRNAKQINHGGGPGRFEVKTFWKLSKLDFLTVHKSQFKKLVIINKLSECRKCEIYEGKKIRKFGCKRSRKSEKVEIKWKKINSFLTNIDI